MRSKVYLTNQREYHSWASMKQRCNNPKDKRFSFYGGRGIGYCDRWESFENFLEDMGSRPNGFTLDRIDNNKGYSKGNCRWADIKTQMNNTSRNKFYVIDGVEKTLSQWAETLNLKSSTVSQRFYVCHWNLRRSLNLE